MQVRNGRSNSPPFSLSQPPASFVDTLELKTEKKRLKKLQEKGMGKIKLGGMGKEKLEAKPWWAFSPSGKWRPGLGTNPNYTRSAGISREQGEPARSIGWVQLKGEK